MSIEGIEHIEGADEITTPVTERAATDAGGATPATAGGPPRYFALTELASGALLAGTCGRGVARSVDGGSTWAVTGELLFTGSNVNGFAAGNGSVMAAAGDAGLAESLDDGATWSSVDYTGAAVYCVTTHDGSWAAGTGDGVMRRTAGGDWQREPQAPDCAIYRMVPLAAGGMAVATESAGVWLQRPDGDWTPTGLAEFPVFALVELDNHDLLAGTRGAGIVRWSRLDGAWRQVLCEPIDPIVHVIVRAVDGALYAGTGQGVFRADDDGDRWLGVGSSLGHHRIFSLLATAGGSVLAGSYDGVWEMTPGANEWSPVDTGLDVGAAFTVAVDADGVAFAGGRAGVFRSTDTGLTWSSVRPEGHAGNAYCFCRTDDGALLVGADDGLWHAGTGLPGATWQRAGLDGHRVFTLIETEPGRLLAGTLGAGVWMRPDADADWRPSTDGLDHPLAFDLMRSPSTGEVLVASGVIEAGVKSGGIFRSPDGEHWQAASLNANTVYDLAETSSGVIVGGAQRCRVLRSTDGGHTFETTRPSGRDGSKMYCLMLDRHDRLYLGAGAELLRSDDAGESWQVVGNGLDGVTVFGLAGFDDDTLLAATSAGVYRSADAGVTWTPSHWSD